MLKYRIEIRRLQAQPEKGNSKSRIVKSKVMPYRHLPLSTIFPAEPLDK